MKVYNHQFALIHSKGKESLSLAEITNRRLELIDFISRLCLCQPEDASSLEHLANKITNISIRETTNSHLIRNLILRQFPRPELDSVREVISNAMDANARAGRWDAPVIINIKDDGLFVQDSGDGIRNIINFWVPGRSANAKTLFNVQQGEPNVTGRFGQGALSIFYYLYSDSFMSLLTQPQFFKDKENISLAFRCEIDGIMHMLKIKAFQSSHGLIFSHEQLPMTKKNLPRLSIHSGEGERAIKIRCLGEQESISLDVAERNKETAGTTIKLHSSLIRSRSKQLHEYITNVFKSCRFSVILNGAPIQEKFLRKLDFNGGTIAFTPLDGQEQKGGTLRLCECGRLVAEFKLSPFSVAPFETTIDFNRLTLSQERASLDFKSEQTREDMGNLIDVIAQTNELTIIERSALFNALAPVVDVAHFNLGKKLQEVFSFMPTNPSTAAPEKENMPSTPSLNYAVMNPEYLSFMNLSAFFSGKNYTLYLNEVEQEPKVIFVDNHFYIFLNSEWMPSSQRPVCEYNLLLMNEWLENSGHTVSIDVSAFCLQKFGSPSLEQTKERIPLSLLSLDFDLDFQKYVFPKEFEKMSNPEYFITFFPKYAHPNNLDWENGLRGFFLTHHQSLQSLKQYFSINDQLVKKYSESQFEFDQPKIKALIKLRVYDRPKELHYLCDAFFSGNKCFEHFGDIIHPDFLKIFKSLLLLDRVDIQQMHSILYAIHTFWKSCANEEKDDYLKFIKSKVTIQSIESLIKINNTFMELQRIVKATGCQEKAIITYMFENFLNDNKCVKEPLQTLAEHIAHTEAAPVFLKKINNVVYCRLLLSWPKKNLARFFELLPDRYLVFTPSDYENILKLSMRKEVPKAILSKWVSIYCYGAVISARIKLTTKYLLQLIDAFIDENKVASLEDLDLLENKMKSCVQYIKISCTNLNLFIRTMRDLMEKTEYSFSDVLSNTEAMKNLLLFKEEYNFPFENLSLEDNIKKACDFEGLKAENDLEGLAAFYREQWEHNGILTATTRPFFFALTLKNHGALLTEDFQWNWRFGHDACFLHKDPDLHKDLDLTGASSPEDVAKRLSDSEDMIKRRLHGAILQSFQEYFFIKEFFKNSREAQAKQINFEIHCDIEKNTIVVFKDNGWGMDLEGLIDLKVPNASSKLQNVEYPNYGWGFYTVFRDFNEVIVVTKKEGADAYCLAFKKTPEGILREYFPIENGASIEVGTTFYLRSRRDPVLSLINLEAELTSICKFFKDVAVSFQGTQICKENNQKTFLEITKGNLRLELGSGEEGIYCKDILVGPLTSDYTHFLPEPVRQFLVVQNLKFRIFLPNAKQVMNRSHLIMDESFLLSSRFLITRAAMDMYVKQWSNDNADNETNEEAKWQAIFSDDCWNRFDSNSIPNSEMIAIKNCLLDKEMKYENPLLATKYGLVEYAKKLLEELKKDRVSSLEIDHQITALASSLEREHKEAIEKLQKQQLQILKEKFSKPEAFAQFIVHYPLNEQGETFMTIRQKFEVNLYAHNLILKSGEYDIDHILARKPEELSYLLANLTTQVVRSCGPVSANILKKMMREVSKMCFMIHKQALTLPMNNTGWHEERLAKFFKQIVLNLGREVNIQFYSANDGRNAYVKRGQNIIFINRKVYVRQLFDLCSESKKLEIEQSEFIKLLSSMIRTLTHEYVHLEEETGCEATHDQRFKRNMAQNLVRMFIGKDVKKQSALALSEIFRE